MKRTAFFLTAAAFTLLFSFAVPAEAEIIGKSVQYSANGKTMKGYLAYDDAKGKRPGLLVVHEWWGLTDYIRKRADMLAELGYTALALDMYGQGKTAAHPDDAGRFSSELMKNFDRAKARFTAAHSFLKEHPAVDAGKIAAVGYCFGGGVVLNMAAQGADLEAAVSFHGTLSLVSPPQPGEIKAKILVLHGGDDQFIKPRQIESFKKELKEAGADYKFVVYPGVMHAFTNPDATANGRKFKIPLAYNEKADKESWQEMARFLKNIFDN